MYRYTQLYVKECLLFIRSSFQGTGSCRLKFAPVIKEKEKGGRGG